MRDIPRYFDDQIANMRAGLKRGFSVPRVVVTDRDKTIEPYLDDRQDQSVLRTVRAMPASIPPTSRRQLKAEADQVIQQSVIPAYRKLHAFIRTNI
jgi:uncharacterized protein (DUF885 family)